MKRQSWLNLLLLAVVVLLALAVWLTPNGTVSTERPKLTTLQPHHIDSIKISNRRGEMELQRNGDSWQITKPYTLHANSPRIGQLLNIATAESQRHFPAPEKRLAQFGLEQPQAVIQLNQHLIQVGSTNPISHLRYLRIGDTIHLIKDRFPHHLMASPVEFAALELLPPGDQLVAITTPDWSISVGKNGKLLLDPPQADLSMDDLNHKITQWQHAQATNVTPLQQADPIGELELITKGGTEPLHFKLVMREGATLLWRPEPGIAYHLPAATTLLTPPAARENP
jgi:hypothetical protein